MLQSILNGHGETPHRHTERIRASGFRCVFGRQPVIAKAQRCGAIGRREREHSRRRAAGPHRKATMGDAARCTAMLIFFLLNESGVLSSQTIGWKARALLSKRKSETKSAQEFDKIWRTDMGFVPGSQIRLSISGRHRRAEPARG